MRLMLFILTFTFALPAQATVKPKAEAKQVKTQRDPSSNLPSRVLTFRCHDFSEDSENILGMAHMSIDLRDSTVGAFSMSLYVRTPKGYTPKTLTGTYTSVPGGFIFRAKWRNANGDYLLLHAHPGDKSQIPGLNAKQSCEILGQLEST